MLHRASTRSDKSSLHNASDGDVVCLYKSWKGVLDSSKHCLNTTNQRLDFLVTSYNTEEEHDAEKTPYVFSDTKVVLV